MEQRGTKRNVRHYGRTNSGRLFVQMKRSLCTDLHALDGCRVVKGEGPGADNSNRRRIEKAVPTNPIKMAYIR